jgi:hypothetical protein
LELFGTVGVLVLFGLATGVPEFFRLLFDFFLPEFFLTVGVVFFVFDVVFFLIELFDFVFLPPFFFLMISRLRSRFLRSKELESPYAKRRPFRSFSMREDVPGTVDAVPRPMGAKIRAAAE